MILSLQQEHYNRQHRHSTREDIKNLKYRFFKDYQQATTTNEQKNLYYLQQRHYNKELFSNHDHKV